MIDPRPAPYPADTRAKGWRFELDYEAIEHSDTWGLAAAMALDGLPLARPLLLAMWYGAWKQTPCGSLPADDRLLAAAVGIPVSALCEYREILLRGWWLADDGRLYHDVVAQRVLEMIEYRRKNAERVAKFKASMREQQSGNALPTEQQLGKNDTGTGTGTISPQKNKSSVESAPKRASRKCPADFVVTDNMRRWAAAEAPRADVDRETEKFRDHTFKTAITDWLGAWRNWTRRASESARSPPGQVMSFRERDAQAAANRVAELTGGLVSAKAGKQPTSPTEVFDAPGTVTSLLG